MLDLIFFTFCVRPTLLQMTFSLKNIICLRTSSLLVFVNVRTNSSTERSPDLSESMRAKRLDTSSASISRKSSKFRKSGSFLKPCLNSSSDIVPELLRPICCARLASLAVPFLRSRLSVFLSCSLASPAFSTITARIRLVNPNCTITSTTAKSAKVHGAFLTMGTAHAPQESPATSVWKKRSTALVTLRKASLQKPSGSQSWLMGCMISTAKIPEMSSRKRMKMKP
mmetsp:Transcript_133589/g.266543  ORF Transcript_133589/g.266543 Transcript_133589/m.266543 type:complete len:226 (+) Transcript_133589:355-1032(+)